VIKVEESGAPPPPATAAVEEGQTTVETAAPKQHQSYQPRLAWVVLTW
jgi:hypothetical protein